MLRFPEQGAAMCYNNCYPSTDGLPPLPELTGSVSAEAAPEELDEAYERFGEVALVRSRLLAERALAMPCNERRAAYDQDLLRRVLETSDWSTAIRLLTEALPSNTS